MLGRVCCLLSWIKAKDFELMVIDPWVIDEAHGCGTKKDGQASTLQKRVTLYTKLTSIQILLIISDPDWEQTGNRPGTRRSSAKPSVSPESTRWRTGWCSGPSTTSTCLTIGAANFPKIEATQQEYACIMAAPPETSAVSKLRGGRAQPNVQELPFDVQAKLLADHVTLDDSTEQWAIWAILKHENKMRLRKMLIERGIKCSEIYNDRGLNAITPGALADAIKKDKTLQDLRRRRTSLGALARGINLYTDVQNCVFWDQGDAQWTNEDRQSQIKSRHARRNTVHNAVTKWEFTYAHQTRRF